MSEPGFASLGPSLLARKGGAKPAMRPQVAPLVTEEAIVAEDQLEDLGWNDMGHDHGDQDGGAEIVPINGAAAPSMTAPGPIVRRQQRRLEQRVLADAAMTGPEDCPEDWDSEYGEEARDAGLYEPGYAGDYDENDGEDDASAVYAPLAAAPIAAPESAPAPAAVTAAKPARRAAFTLRLDADRHLKLRLAATMHGVSAQVVVTEALDRLLSEYDDLDIIANHLKRH
jgi:hypothetical protein